MATKNSAKSVWETLAEIDVTTHIEQKGKFSYISWAWAWALVKQNYPVLPFMRDSLTYTYVSCSVTIDGITQKEIFPVLGNKNEPLKAATSFQVNTAHQRCLVKCLAYHGFGTNVYAGEDLPVMDANFEIKKATKTDQDHAHYQRIDSLLASCNSPDELMTVWKNDAPVISKIDNKVVTKLQGHYKTYLNALKAKAA